MPFGIKIPGVPDKIPGLPDVGKKIDEMKDKAKQAAADKAFEMAMDKLPADKINLSSGPVKSLVTQSLKALGFSGEDKDLLTDLNSALGLKGKNALTDLKDFGPKQLSDLYGKLKEAGHADEFREKFVGAIKSEVPDFKLPEASGLLKGHFSDAAVLPTEQVAMLTADPVGAMPSPISTRPLV